MKTVSHNVTGTMSFSEHRLGRVGNGESGMRLRSESPSYKEFPEQYFLRESANRRQRIDILE